MNKNSKQEMEKLADENDNTEVVYPKAYFFEYLVLAIIYFLGFFFFLYITVFVIRKEEKKDKVLVSMLIFLQLSSLSKYL